MDATNLLKRPATIGIDGETVMEERKSNNFVRNGRVYILGDFDDTISRYVVPDMIELVGLISGTKDAVIPVFINSPGGEADKLQSILSVFSLARQHGIKISTYNIGVAYSCGSLLAVSGDMRFMAAGARNMMHLGQTTTINSTYEQLKRNTKDAREFFDDIVSIYAERTKLSPKKIREILNDDMYWMNSKECLKAGLCDAII